MKTKQMTFTTGEQNLMKKWELDKLNPFAEPLEELKGVNLYSGIEIALNPWGYKLYILLIDIYQSFGCVKKKASVGEYDRLKYLFLKVLPNAYYDLIN